jgi:hypothetical protein
MTQAYRHSELEPALDASGREVAGFFGGIAAGVFFAGDQASWSCAHHLGHLTIAHGAIARGLSSKAKLAPRDGSPSRHYEEMRETYRRALAAAPAAFLAANPFVPKLGADATVESCVQEFRAADGALVAALAGWTDAELDTRSMTHPLLGPISAREMLIFNVYHDQHHLHGVRRRLGIAAAEG